MSSATTPVFTTAERCRHFWHAAKGDSSFTSCPSMHPKPIPSNRVVAPSRYADSQSPLPIDRGTPPRSLLLDGSAELLLANSPFPRPLPTRCLALRCGGGVI